MTIFISLVSHSHSKIISELATMSELSSEAGFVLVVKNNTADPGLSECLIGMNVHLIDDESLYGLGFGENNNCVFNYCVSMLGMSGGDLFCVLNPDVLVDSISLSRLADLMDSDGCLMSSINLYLNTEKSVYDNSIRKFPGLFSFFGSYLSLVNLAIDKREVQSPIDIDWAAGSFLMFKAFHYANLGGFDEGYFMYCEDIDICFRSFKKGVRVRFYPSVSAVHYAGFANRKMFSRHFLWHVKSAFRFIAVKHGLVRQVSSVCNF